MKPVRRFCSNSPAWAFSLGCWTHLTVISITVVFIVREAPLLSPYLSCAYALEEKLSLFLLQFSARLIMRRKISPSFPFPASSFVEAARRLFRLERRLDCNCYCVSAGMVSIEWICTQGIFETVSNWFESWSWCREEPSRVCLCVCSSATNAFYAVISTCGQNGNLRIDSCVTRWGIFFIEVISD